MFDKEKDFTNREVTNYLLNIYVLLSLVFICMTLYTDVKVQYGSSMFNNGVQAGLNQGGEAGYKQAVNEALEKSKVCEPFALFAGEETASLINIDCLQSAQPGNTQQASGTGNTEPVAETGKTDPIQ